MPDQGLASALRRLRTERGLTQEAVAHAAGLTTSGYARAELGQSSPSWETIRAIIDALGVSLAELAAAIEAQQ